jgi:YD repeat-containing protein
MQRRWIGIFCQWTALAMLCCFGSLAKAQTYAEFSPPDIKLVDSAGVSLISGHGEFRIAPLSIGPRGAPLVYSERYEQVIGHPENGMYGSVVGGNNWAAYPAGYVVVKVFDKSEVFWGDRVSSYQSWSQSGGILTVSNGNVTRYTDRDGVQYNFKPVSSLSVCTNNLTSPGLTEINTLNPFCAVLTDVTYPDGSTLTMTDLGINALDFQNISIVRSDGFAIHADYYSYVNAGGATVAVLTGLKGVNLAVDYCDMTQLTLNCSFSQTWPTATYSWSPTVFQKTVGASQIVSVTDQSGSVTRYSQAMFASAPQGNLYPAVTAVKAPSSAGADTTSYSTYFVYACVDGGGYWNCSTLRDGLVDSATTDAGTWSYTYANPGYPSIPVADPNSQNWVTQATRADGFQATAQYNTRTTYLQSVVTSTGSMFYANSNPNRLVKAVDSEGRTFTFSYDGRGNTTLKQQVGSDGSLGPAWQAGFDATCTLPVKCNKPNWILDPNGNETDYTYDPTHGGIITETLPADSSGVRPQKRYSYVQRYAWTKNASGGYSPSASPIWKLSSMSLCVTGTWNGTSCVDSQQQPIVNDLVTTTYEYGPNAGPNNLLVRGVVVTSGSASHRTCIAYDGLGNKISETTPNAGLTSCP